MNLWDLFFGRRLKKVFISFAFEDVQYRDFLVAQAKKENSPFEFIDMSAKAAWKQHEWQRKCRTKIRQCDGVIVLLSKDLPRRRSTLGNEVGNQEKIPMVGMHIKKRSIGAIPKELKGKKIIYWTWKELERVIENF